MFTSSVSFQVMRVPGVTNRYFGGDAHHFAVLSGPGAVWLQSMPLPVLAASFAAYLPQAQGDQRATEGGGGGGAAGGRAGAAAAGAWAPREAETACGAFARCVS